METQVLLQCHLLSSFPVSIMNFSALPTLDSQLGDPYLYQHLENAVMHVQVLYASFRLRWLA